MLQTICVLASVLLAFDKFNDVNINFQTLGKKEERLNKFFSITQTQFTVPLHLSGFKNFRGLFLRQRNKRMLTADHQSSGYLGVLSELQDARKVPCNTARCTSPCLSYLPRTSQLNTAHLGLLNIPGLVSQHQLHIAHSMPKSLGN